MDKKGEDRKMEYKILGKIFMKMENGFLIMDKDKRIMFMNQHMVNIYGNQIGKKCYEIFFDRTKQCKVCSMYEILKENKELIRYTPRCYRDKSGRWIEMTCMPSIIASESPQNGNAHMMIVINDITARKKSQEIIRKKNLELKKINKELENFVSTVSHTLKSPIFSILGLVSALIEDYPDKLDSWVKIYLEDIRNSIQKMGQLILDLLNLSRAGRTINPRAEVPAGEIIEEAIEQIKFQLNALDAKLYIEENLPTCYCDKEMIMTALVNFLDNAVKYMGDNPYPSIEIGCQTEGNFQTFFVKDNGIGIDPKYHEKIFEIFHSLDEIKDSKSSGVGLAIVKKVVERHMGKVWVESEKGKGAKFLFRLPSKESVILKKENPLELSC